MSMRPLHNAHYWHVNAHKGTHAHPFTLGLAVNSVCLWQISLVWQLLELRF